MFARMQSDPAEELEYEIELLRRVGQGDQRSFAEFYDRAVALLFGIALRLMNSREAAEDVVQEVFLQIWEKAPLFDPGRGKPMTWAVTLTRNKAIDRIRSAQRRARLQDELKREATLFEEGEERSSFDAVSLGEVGKLARGALEKLPPEQREAIELAFLHSLSQSEIAERLGEPLGTIKARIRRGLAKMRDLLSERV